jgi:ppGpp synthetase/RelA/SpoT-type nucleotidyltranferase
MAKANDLGPLAPMTRETYERESPKYRALCEEAIFVLDEALANAQIKTHGIESRVKGYDSICKKARDHAGEDRFEITDISGVRIICLFKADLQKVDSVVRSEFEVISKDDKVTASADSFGYMSVHYICRMKSEYVGPRYSQIRDVNLEIQVRTLCMHAWAAISHHLDYKAEWDIPVDLRKGLNALSGLFYVADEQYESLFRAREASRASATERIDESKADLQINLDTITAFIRNRFPDREKSGSESISTFVRELLEIGLTSIDELARILDDIEYKFSAWEKSYVKKNDQKLKYPFYTDLGATRVSIRLGDERYRKFETERAERAALKRVASKNLPGVRQKRAAPRRKSA